MPKPSITPNFSKWERVRRKYRPRKVRILFIGEAPPASGRFFYNEDSGLYRALREVFQSVLPSLTDEAFLPGFQKSGCYLIDLCGRPVDKLSSKARRRICSQSEPKLAAAIRSLHPQVIVVLVRSIAVNVRRAESLANWSGEHLEVPYPGRWHHHRSRFLRALIPFLRRKLSSES